jgi:deoxyribodipyrimidine photo-lyase
MKLLLFLRDRVRPTHIFKQGIMRAGRTRSQGGYAKENFHILFAILLLMSVKYKKSLFIFRRDLRFDDNSGLIKALRESESVVPCFIFDPVQIEHNDYFSPNAFEFMITSLKELDLSLKSKGSELYLFHGEPSRVVGEIAKETSLDAVYLNIDYTPFSKERDSNIGDRSKSLKIDFHQVHDALINPPEMVLKSDGKPYTVFTPFYNKAKLIPVAKPQRIAHKNYYNGRIKSSSPDLLKEFDNYHNPDIYLKGGRKEGLSLLKRLSNLHDYAKTRDFPSIDGTSSLSAHLKFGTISVREVYKAVIESLGEGFPLIRQLYWRDFFTSIGYFFPFVFGEAFHRKYNMIRWSKDERKLNAWKEGRTGFPIVDAGMRQLYTTGFMHNRVRMITASFLVKDLHIDWLEGEKHFAQYLIDYDPCVNNGNWQWAASTGCDAQPYFRIFNPWNQQRKFDPGCEYIKKWVPEVDYFPPGILHNWNKRYSDDKTDYFAPIVDHAVESLKARQFYKAVLL